MTVTQIQLNTKGFLDLGEDIPVPITFSVAPVQNISLRQGSFSKTIRVPGTPNNNRLLGYLFNVNIYNSTFDIRRKEAVSILKNGVSQFDGYMQMLSVSKTAPALPNGDEIVWYDMAVKNDAGDFFTAIGDDYIDTLPAFSAVTIPFNLSTVLNSSGNTWQDIYKFYMPWHLRPAYTLQDFGVTTSAKVIFDEIFKASGYLYDWKSMSGTGFDKTWIPYNGDIVQRTAEQINQLKFKASFSSGVNLDYDLGYLGPNQVVSNPPFISTTPTPPGGAVIYYNPQQIIFDDDTTSGTTGNLFDNLNQYDTSTGTFISAQNGFMEFQTAYIWELFIENTSATDTIKLVTQADTGTGTGTINQDAYYSINMYADLTVIHPGSGQTTVKTTLLHRFESGDISPASPLTYTPGFTKIAGGNFTSSSLLEVFVSSILDNKIRYTFEYDGQYAWVSTPGDLYKTRPKLWFKILRSVTDYRLQYFQNVPGVEATNGTNLKLTNLIPKKIKRKDFISSIVKMFNLYISPTDQDKVLKIETRDEYYDSGKELNWTNKFVKNQDATIKFLPDLQSKKIIFSYKEDKDNYNAKYKTGTGENYGQLQYEFDTDFNTDTKEIELVFSPTPLALNGFGLPVPTIDARAPKNNIRILYDGGTIQSPDQRTWTYTANTGAGPVEYTFDSYPYMGHFDNPFNPTRDFDWGQNSFMFYDSFLTDSNLYNMYYRRYISQIENGKMLVCKMNLLETDICSLNLRDKIYINDNKYFINKINDYDCNSSDSITEVEFINVDEGIKFTPGKVINTSGVVYLPPPTNNQQSANRTSQYGSGSFNNSDAGDFNVFQPGSSYNNVAGMGNNINGTSMVINGNGNNVQGNNNSVQGDSNTVL